MRKDGVEAAKVWLDRNDSLVTFQRDDVVIGELKPDRRKKVGLEVEWELVETACLIVDEITLDNGNARSLYRRLVQWKHAEQRRCLALFVPRDINPARLVEFKEAVVTVGYPLVSFAGSWVTA